MSEQALAIALEMQSEINARTYLPDWLSNYMDSLVGELQGTGTTTTSTTTATTTNDIDSLTTAKDVHIWETADGDFDLPFTSRGFEVLQQSNQFSQVQLVTADGSDITFTTYGNQVKPLATTRVIAAGTTATQIMFYK